MFIPTDPMINIVQSRVMRICTLIALICMVGYMAIYPGVVLAGADVWVDQCEESTVSDWDTNDLDGIGLSNNKTQGEKSFYVETDVDALFWSDSLSADSSGLDIPAIYLDLYIDSLTGVTSAIVEISSNSTNDEQELYWTIEVSDLVADWNSLTLEFDDATTAGDAFTGTVTWMRVQVVHTGEIAFRLDNIYLTEGEVTATNTPTATIDPGATSTPNPVMDYIEIQDGEYMGIERTVTFGDMAVVSALLAILATVFILVAYKLVTDKLP